MQKEKKKKKQLSSNRVIHVTSGCPISMVHNFTYVRKTLKSPLILSYGCVYLTVVLMFT